MAIGRPTVMTLEVRQHILTQIMTGRSLREICRNDDTAPSRESVHKCIAEDQAFADQYAHAASIRADELFDEMFDIADDSENDWIERKRQDGTVEEVENREAINRSKLRIDTRKWALSKMMPKKYGDKLDLNHSGINIHLHKDAKKI